MTEEEVNCLKEKCLVLETDLRLVMDERRVLQQMFDEKSGQVKVLQQRLAGKSTFHSPFIETLSLQLSLIHI